MIHPFLKKGCLLVAAFFMTVAAFAQTTVRGTVVGEDNQPVFGAAVIEVGNAQNGVMVEADGSFVITVKSGASVEVTCLGYATQTLPAANGMKVVMVAESQMVEETVVVGYTTQRKSDLTGSVTVVSVEDLKNTPSLDVMSAMQGRVAGMNVTQTGDPSARANIRIRGVGTLNNTDPLYIIDGMPSTNGIREINASDIQSIQVLKDAASASIYGSRAANGVIIVTTNRGQEGSLRINFNASGQVSMYPRLIDLCDAEQFGEALYRAYTHDGYDPNTNPYGYNFDASGKMTNKIGVDDLLNANTNMTFSSTDWWDEITQTSFRQTYELSVSNGTRNGQYYFSLGYTSGNGIVINSRYNRYNARVNSSYNLFKNLVTIGENLTVSYSDEMGAASNTQGTSVLNLAYADMPNVPVHTKDGLGWGGPVGGMSDRMNVARIVNDARNNSNTGWRLFGSAYIDIRPIKGLTIHSSFSPEYSSRFNKVFVYPYQDGNLGGNELSVALTNNNSLNWTWSTTANYALELKKLRANFLLGHEMIHNSTINQYSKTLGYALADADYMWPNASTGSATVTGLQTVSALQSVFGKIDLTFNNKYLLGLTARYDGSSKFGKDNQFAFFPSISAGWRISQEPFMKGLTWLTDLKLRASWGTNGNQQIADGGAYTLYDPGAGATSTQIVWGMWRFATVYDMAGAGTGTLSSGFRRTQDGNSSLKWETSEQWDLGFDYNFWNYKLYGTFDWFYKNTYDILVRPTVPGVLGEGAQRYENGATLENRGIELSIGTRGKTNFGLTYDISGNLYTWRNKVTYLPESVLSAYPGNGTTDTVIGRNLNSYYGYRALGLYSSEAELNDGIKVGSLNRGKGLGRIKWDDVNGDGEITTADRVFFGSPEPDFSFGLNINLGYKNWDFSMFWEGKVGYLANTGDKSQRTLFVTDMGSNKGADILDAWTPENPNSKIPALTTTNNNNESTTSTYFYEDHSYAKLRNISLGYSFSNNFTKKIGLSRCRLYVTGQNLFWFNSKDFTGADPEMTGFGYPNPRNVLFGAQISF